jgi:hypothetical protein
MNDENETPEGPVKNPRYSQQAYGYLKKLWNTSTKSTRTESKQRSEKSSPTMLETKPKERQMELFNLEANEAQEPKERLVELFNLKANEAQEPTVAKGVEKVSAKQIRAYIKANPKALARKVAAAMGVDVKRVYSIRHYDKAATKKKKVAARNAWTLASITTSKTSIAEKLNAGANGTSVADMVNHPPHYKVGGIETIQFIKAKLTKEEYIGYLRGNVLKYASRLGAKNNASEDAGKMAWYAKQLEQSMKR